MVAESSGSMASRVTLLLEVIKPVLINVQLVIAGVRLNTVPSSRPT